jgi:hypothetical protein
MREGINVKSATVFEISESEIPCIFINERDDTCENANIDYRFAR